MVIISTRIFAGATQPSDLSDIRIDNLPLSALAESLLPTPPGDKVLVGGDQMTATRTKSAIKAKKNAESPSRDHAQPG